jgi:hypothetical protein
LIISEKNQKNYFIFYQMEKFYAFDTDAYPGFTFLTNEWVPLAPKNWKKDFVVRPAIGPVRLDEILFDLEEAGVVYSPPSPKPYAMCYRKGQYFSLEQADMELRDMEPEVPKEDGNHQVWIESTGEYDAVFCRETKPEPFTLFRLIMKRYGISPNDYTINDNSQLVVREEAARHSIPWFVFLALGSKSTVRSSEALHGAFCSKDGAIVRPKKMVAKGKFEDPIMIIHRFSQSHLSMFELLHLELATDAPWGRLLPTLIWVDTLFAHNAPDGFETSKTVSFDQFVELVRKSGAWSDEERKTVLSHPWAEEQRASSNKEYLERMMSTIFPETCQEVSFTVSLDSSSCEESPCDSKGPLTMKCTNKLFGGFGLFRRQKGAAGPKKKKNVPASPMRIPQEVREIVCSFLY